jgi:ubiquinol-cytochrome c reductase cytochrome c1 subunit
MAKTLRYFALPVLLGATLALASGTLGAKEGAAWREQMKANNDINSTASLQRGARNFVNYCLGCHSLQYVRYNRVAEDLGIPEDQLEANLMFTGNRPHDAMVSAMPARDGETWFGRAPPDLSLVARAKGTDYVYQFLKTFYLDESRASTTGVNNLALENAAMPHVLADLQGLQRAVFNVERAEDGTQVKVFEKFEQVIPGRLSPEEYDEFVRDTVNFLDYAAEPVQLKRVSLGIWVIAFLVVFTGFAYALKKEIWKDVH